MDQLIRRLPMLALGVLITVGILARAFFNRAWLLEAIRLARSAQLGWLMLGVLTITSSFLISRRSFKWRCARWGGA